MYNIQENNFINSLSHCIECNINGRKKGTFCKTLDDKYLMKFIKLDEFKMFLNVFPMLFSYMVRKDQTITSLVPIFACYGISFAYFNEHSMDTMQYLLVMPNLFNGINENKLLKFDLKGTVNKTICKW